MDPRSQGVLVNAAGTLYAFTGFLLSVLAALYALFGSAPKTPPNTALPSKSKHPKPPKPHLHPDAPRRPSTKSPTRPSPIRSFSERPPNLSDDDAASTRKKLLATRRRSRSIPVITIDFFSSTDNLNLQSVKSAGVQPETSDLPAGFPTVKRKPLTFVIPPVPERDWAESTGFGESRTETLRQRYVPAPVAEVPERPFFERMFSKEKERMPKDSDKEKEKPRSRSHSRPRKVISRRKSAPQIPTTDVTPDEVPPVPPLPPMPNIAKVVKAARQSNGSASDNDSAPEKSCKKDKSPKIRKSQSTQEKLSEMQSFFSRPSVEKKKSLNLRTQPYEAPYNCPPPIPSHSPSTRSSSESIDKPRRRTVQS